MKQARQDALGSDAVGEVPATMMEKQLKDKWEGGHVQRPARRLQRP